MQWTEVLASPYLQELPFKIELNKWGQILMSPASNRHGNTQSELVYAIRSAMPTGKIFVECSIATSDGVKVADVAWASDAFIARVGNVTPFPRAPELCIEVVSPSNSKGEIDHKLNLYFAHGAQEVWIAKLDGRITMYQASLPIKKSGLVPKFKMPKL